MPDRAAVFPSRRILAIAVLGLLLSPWGQVVSAESSGCKSELNYEAAAAWWPPQRNVWTPIGWKNHYFRFNVVYNGTILAEPCPHSTVPRAHARKWLGQSFQMSFVPSPGAWPPELPEKSTKVWKLDGGVGIQGWREDHPTPVLWTDWPLQEGLVIRQEVFAHVPGRQEVESGIERRFSYS